MANTPGNIKGKEESRTTNPGQGGQHGAHQGGQHGGPDKGRGDEGLMGKAKDAATGVMERAKDAASSAAQTAGEYASTAGEYAESAASAVGSGMKSLAGTIRENAPREGMLGRAGTTVADSLETGSRYLQEEGLSGMMDDLSALVRRNPLPAVLVGIGLGFMLARITRS